MALLEAVAVAYLRALLRINDSHVALGTYIPMEIGREVATIVMLVAVGWLAGRRRGDRWAYGLFAFGLWDIWYYIWLKVLIDWPKTLLNWDILFLIPVRWWGPVLSPVLIAMLICLITVLAVVRWERGESLQFTPARIGVISLGGLLALYVFMSDSLHALWQGCPDWDTLRPAPFQWPLFLLALGLMAVPSLMATWSRRK
ncbi:MAG: hypothetical protein PHR77_13165 [Kiritimatiellae bacterium]|nr:hypothetical protein [Kiritimatiellia bacterium]MDD5520173.1 hypothetical protein [Kiritimatiellia bacterium]